VASLNGKRVLLGITGGIAANAVGQSGSGFESSHNALTVFTRAGRHDIPLTTKRQAADALLAILREHLP